MTHLPPPAVRFPGSLAPLGYRDFALYWLGFTATNTGRWIELTGALWLVYDLTASPILLGLIGVARAVPSVVLSPLAGVVADRVDLKRLLILTQLAGMAASVLLGITIVWGHLELWHVYAQLGIQSGIRAFDAAGRQALFPQLVPRRDLSHAVTLTVTAGRSAKFIGAAAGGLIIAWLGVGAPFLLNGAAFVVLTLAVWVMRHPARMGASTSASLKSEFVDGLRYIVQAPVLSGLLKLEIVFSLLQMNEVMVTILARDVLRTDAAGLGLLLSAPALGSVLGIGGMLLFMPSRPGQFAILCTLAYVGALVFVAASPVFGLTFAALSVVGLLDALVTVTRHSVMQLAAPPAMRGRVMANMNTITLGVGPLANAQSGFLAGLLGAPWAILASAGLLAAFAGVASVRNVALWHVQRGSLRDPSGVDP